MSGTGALSIIRPLPPLQVPPPQAQRLTGQSALFALARAKMAEQAAAPGAPQAAAPTAAPTAGAEPPQKPLRPGSFIDIRV